MPFAIEAVTTGLAVSASIFGTTANDGICTQAERTRTSAFAIFIPCTMPVKSF